MTLEWDLAKKLNILGLGLKSSFLTHAVVQ